LLLGARAGASAAPEGRTSLHLAAMGGHEDAVMCLLAVAPEVVQQEDHRGLKALHYARLHGFPEVAKTLEAEEEEQKALYVQWWDRFEPDSRARLSERCCEVFLEVGRPWLLGAGAAALRLGCRVVDSLGLFERFAVDLRAGGLYAGSEAAADENSMHEPPAAVRLPAQLVRHDAHSSHRPDSRGRGRRRSLARDGPDVELRVSLPQALAVSGGRLGDLLLRIIGEVEARAGAQAGVACREVRSPWVCPVRFAGSPVVGSSPARSSPARGSPARGQRSES